MWVNQVGGFNIVDGKKEPSDRLRISFDMWGRKLSGLSGEQIEKGLDNLPEEYPPSPAKFLKLCTGYGQGLSQNTEAYKQRKSVIGIEMSPELKENRKKAAHRWREEIKNKYGV